MIVQDKCGVIVSLLTMWAVTFCEVLKIGMRAHVGSIVL